MVSLDNLLFYCLFIYNNFIWFVFMANETDHFVYVLSPTGAYSRTCNTQKYKKNKFQWKYWKWFDKKKWKLKKKNNINCSNYGKKYFGHDYSIFQISLFNTCDIKPCRALNSVEISKFHLDWLELNYLYMLYGHYSFSFCTLSSSLSLCEQICVG